MSRSPRILIPALLGVIALVALVFMIVRSDEGPDTPAAASAPTTAPSTTPAPDGAVQDSAAPQTAPPETSGSVTPSTGDEATYTPVFEEGSCDFVVPDGHSPRCGVLVVPEDRSTPEGSKVRLPVAIFPSTGSDPAPDPLFYLGPGGPGGATLEALQFGFEQWDPFLTERDLIFWDMRGVGLAQPSLDCPEERRMSFDSLDDDLSEEARVEAELEAYRACRDRLVADGVDLTRYNSATAAADVADLQRALGYEEWNLLGISYATRLELTVMRDHPDGLRSVILDSTYTPDVDLFASLAPNLDRALDRLFAACESDAACADEYPDLEARTFALADTLDESPVVYTARDLIEGGQYEVHFDGTDLLAAIFNGLYSEEIIPRLPELVAELERGETGIASLLTTNDLSNSHFLSTGLYQSVQCNEEIAFTSREELAGGAAGFPELSRLFGGADDLDLAIGVCDLWDAGSGSPVENQVVSSTVPTLILSGSYDPITPPAWGSTAGATLPNSIFVEFDTLAHGISLAGECPAAVIGSFLEDPSAPPDTGCIATMAPIQFVTVPIDAASIELEPFEDTVFGVSLTGLAPAEWDKAGPGTWSRGRDGLDQTSILQFVSSASPELVVELFAAQLSLDPTPVFVEERRAGAFDWQLFRGALDQFTVDIAVGDGEGVDGLVIMIAETTEHEVMSEAVLFPALEAFRVN